MKIPNSKTQPKPGKFVMEFSGHVTEDEVIEFCKNEGIEPIAPIKISIRMTGGIGFGAASGVPSIPRSDVSQVTVYGQNFQRKSRVFKPEPVTSFAIWIDASDLQKLRNFAKTNDVEIETVGEPTVFDRIQRQLVRLSKPNATLASISDLLNQFNNEYPE